ncbi:hypothetical protein [Promicromonospora sp. NPDC050249]
MYNTTPGIGTRVATDPVITCSADGFIVIRASGHRRRATVAGEP